MGFVLFHEIRRRLESGEFAPQEATDREIELYAQWSDLKDEKDRALIAAEAVGLNPSRPPKWALLSCWVYAERNKRAVRSGSMKHLMPELLDEVILALLKDEDTHWERQLDQHDAKNISAPFEPRPFEGRLAGAIQWVIEALDVSIAERTVRRGWDEEQAVADRHDEEDAIITGYRNTPRIRRIYNEWSELKANPDAVPAEYRGVFALLNGWEE